MPRIPLPKRSIRSLSILMMIILGPYLVVRQLGLIAGHTSGSGDGGAGAGPSRRAAGLFGMRKAASPALDLGLDDDSLGSGGRRKAGRARGAGGLVLQYDGGAAEPLANHGDGMLGAGKKAQAKAKAKGKGKAKAPAADKVRAKAKAKPKPNSQLPQHKFRDDGLLVVNPKGRHPIYDLIEKARENWDGKLERASKTLGQAVNEYRRRYGRAPPKGFDRWWAYVEANDVQLPDEYDQIYKDLDPFYALPPRTIQALVTEAASRGGMYTVYCPGVSALPKSDDEEVDPEATECTYDINTAGLHEGAQRIARERAEGQISLLEDIRDQLEEVEAVFYSEDVPWQFVGHEYKGALEDAAAVGEYLNVEEHDLDWAHLGWASACAPHKPLRKSYDHEVLPDLEELWNAREKTFIWDHKTAMDPCIHPTMTHLVGFLSGHGKGPGPSKELLPVMAMCKTTLHSDVLAVSMEAWTEDVGDDPPWEQKKDDRMLWRGKNTGIYFKDGVPWDISQRVNLVERTALDEGYLPLLDVTPDNAPVGAPRQTLIDRLNTDLMDVAFVDEPIQCDPEICEIVKETYAYKGRKDWKAGNQYKYLLDLDGNGWSARFKRLMSTNSVVLKSTIFPEWYQDRIQPWIHYVPIKADLTDLYDVLAFFREGHDDLAKEIADEGKVWSKSFWRKEDMVSYQFRLFLEYARLMAPNRELASYDVKGSELGA
ncbi:hypothetical protein JCM24511_01229 [Saitozyma sp. JCM 24511]|nr:hypothetical protein JCM24511_01229 [Saitozyma sp. JCM 24511]